MTDSFSRPLAKLAVLVACACSGAGDTRETTTATSGPSTSIGTTTSDESSGVTTSHGESTSVADGSSGADGASSSGDETGCERDCPVVWPNDDSRANSDPWIAEHHAEIDELRPNVLAINYVNARSMAEMNAQLEDMIEILAEASRPHGYADASAPPMVRYQLAHSIDLRDAVPPDGWPYRNSTLYPREDPVDEYWGFDYEALFTPAYAELLGLEDPDMPGVNLGLCDAIDRGLVHEIWIYGDGDVPDVSAAEVLEWKPRYDESRVRIPGEMDGCAGNGCFDQEDAIPCTRTVRIAWFNNTRGPGCFLESLSHGLEGTGRKGGTIVPYLSRYFPEITGMDLDDRYGTPFESWYSCPYGVPCLSYPTESSVMWTMDGGQSGSIDDYDPVCGNVHWPPNATSHYDLAGTSAVRSSCTHWRDGTGQTELYTADAIAPYLGLAPDCMGAFLVWWRQNLPGKDSTAIDDSGAPVLSFWPFQFY